MPGPSQCNKIADPVERKKCLQYKGKYAKKAGSPAKAQKKMAKPTGGGSY